MAKLYKRISVFLLFVATCFSATNDTTIDSATLKRIYMGNYSYNTCISSQPILTMRWASDLNRPVFKNRTGTLYKALMDASTTSNTPNYRAFFADSNGRASSSSVYTYTNGNLHAPYFTGDSTVVTGKVKGSSGVFSGRITGTDIDVSDSIKGVTGNYTSTVTAKDVNITDLTSGYIPYKSTNLENSNIFTNGTNTSIGKSSVESWGTAQRAVQVGGNTAIMGNAVESGSNFTWLLNNAYYDGTWKPYSNGSTSSFRIGATGILFEHDTGLTADIGYSPTTRLSWTLSGGLNVTNKIVTSDSIIAVSGKFSGRITATDIQLTDSVKAVSGAYSGRITGTDLEVSDSVKAVSGAFSGRITGTDLHVSDSIKSVFGEFSGTINRGKFLVDSVIKIGDNLTYPYYSDSPIWGISDLHIRGLNRFAKARFTAVGNGNKSWLAFDRANGTFEAPTGLLSGDHFASILGVGYPSGASDMTHGPELALEVTQNWTTLAKGCALHFKSIPNNMTRQVSSLYLNGYKSVFGSIDTSEAMITVRDSTPKTNQLAIYGLSTTAPLNIGTFIDETYIYSNLYYLGGWAQNNSAFRSYGLQFGNNGFGIYKTNAGSTTRACLFNFDTSTNTGTFISGVEATDFRASDSIKGVNGAFTGRITATTLHASDTVKSEYGRFSNIIADGDGVRFNTKNEVSFIYKDSINNNTIFGCKYSPGDGNVASVVLSNLTLDSTLVTRTDSVIVKKFVAKSIKSTSLNTDTLKINSNIFDYSSGSIDLTMYGFASSPTSVSFSYVKIGNVVTLKSNTSTYSTSNAGEFYFAGLPSNITPSSLVTFASVPKNAFSDNSAIVTSPVTAKITSAGGLYLYLGNSLSGGWTASGNKGYQTFNITYSL